MILAGSADMVEARRHGLSCVNRVEQQALAPGTKINGLKCLLIEFAVARLECFVGNFDIFRFYGILQFEKSRDFLAALLDPLLLLSPVPPYTNADHVFEPGKRP